MKKNEFFIGPEAKEAIFLKDKIVIQPLEVTPRSRAIILNKDAKSEMGIKDFNGNHPYLGRVIAIGKEVKDVAVNDIIAISERVIVAGMKGGVSEVMLDGEAYAIIHETDVIAIMNYYRDKIVDGKIDKE